MSAPNEESVSHPVTVDVCAIGSGGWRITLRQTTTVPTSKDCVILGDYANRQEAERTAVYIAAVLPSAEVVINEEEAS